MTTPAMQSVATGGAPSTTISAIIPTGTAITPSIDLGSNVIGAIEMPAAWTAADLVVWAASSESGTYKRAWLEYGELKITTATASRIILVDVRVYPLRYIKLQSVSTADSDTGVNQTRDGGTTLTLHVRPV